MDEQTAKTMVLVSKLDLKDLRDENAKFRQTLAEIKVKIRDINGTVQACHEIVQKWMEAKAENRTSPQVTRSSTSKKRKKQVRSGIDTDVEIEESSDSDDDYQPSSPKKTKKSVVSVPITRATTTGVQKVNYKSQLTPTSPLAKRPKMDNSIDRNLDGNDGGGMKVKKAERTNIMPVGKVSRRKEAENRYSSPMLSVDEDNESEEDEDFDFEQTLLNEQLQDSITYRKMEEQLVDSSDKKKVEIGSKLNSTDIVKKKNEEKDDTFDCGTEIQEKVGKKPKSKGSVVTKAQVVKSTVPQRYSKVVPEGIVLNWVGRVADSFFIDEQKYRSLCDMMVKAKGYNTIGRFWGKSIKPSKDFFIAFRAVVLRIITDITADVKTNGTIYIFGEYHLEEDDRDIDDYIAALPEPMITAVEVASRVFFEQTLNPVIIAAQYEVVKYAVNEISLHYPTYQDE